MSYSTLHTAYPYPPTSPHHDPAENAVIEEHRQKFGGHNDTPPGWREISEEEFVKGKFFTYSPEKVEARQLTKAGVKADSGSPLINARLYFFHDETGVAMMDDHWAGKIRFFAFGCAHEWKEITHAEARSHGLRPVDSFDHAYRCEKCGATKMVNTSD